MYLRRKISEKNLEKHLLFLILKAKGKESDTYQNVTNPEHWQQLCIRNGIDHWFCIGKGTLQFARMLRK